MFQIFIRYLNLYFALAFVFLYIQQVVLFASPDKIVRPYRVYDLECQTLGFKKIYYWGNKIREASLFYFRFNKFEDKN